MGFKKVCLLSDPKLGHAPSNALHVLSGTLSRLGMSVCQVAGEQYPDDAILLSFETGPCGVETTAASKGPESFTICKREIHRMPVIAVHGSEEVGLMYGIFELLGQIESMPSGANIFETFTTTTQSAELRVRGVSMFVLNRDLEREWIYSREFWQRYFGLLAQSRFNRFTLTFGHQTSLFAPPFPFIIDVPGSEQVRVPSWTNDERDQNLKMLQMVSSLAEEWGINFVLGIWLQHAYRYGENLVQGLTYEELFDYCPEGLRILLKECPKIKGVQFRVNHECGIEEDHQERFFRKMFEVIAGCGRPMLTELRAKGLRQETIESATATLGNFVVSTKFWCEHMGLPYFATEINPRDIQSPYSYRRYGYWDLLRHDRPYKILYQLWTHGSQRLLLWGDMDYTTRFAKSCHLGDGSGFEIAAPLSNKGYGNRRNGAWHIMADRSREYYDWEFERYWAFYMAFGLAGYAAKVEQPIFKAEFSRRFGPSLAPGIMKAYKAASKFLPLITAWHCKSASVFRYWPEMDTGGLTDLYIGVPSGDRGRFYSIVDYVDDVIADKLSGKIKPSAVAERFRDMADKVIVALKDIAQYHLSPKALAELESTRIDLEVAAEMARYHAARILSGEAYLFFRKTAERSFLIRSIEKAEEALSHWERVVQLTDGIYYDNMDFGIFENTLQIGHWKDELPLLRHDVDRLKKINQLFVKYKDDPLGLANLKVEYPWYEMKIQWRDDNGMVRRWVGDKVSSNGIVYPAYEEHAVRHILQDPTAVVKDVLGSGGVAGVPQIVENWTREHTEHRALELSVTVNVVKQCLAGVDLTIRATVQTTTKLLFMRLHYRHLNQAENWQVVEMKHKGNEYKAIIPGKFIDPAWDIMYAIEVMDIKGQGGFYPELDMGQPYMVVSVVPVATNMCSGCLNKKDKNKC